MHKQFAAEIKALESDGTCRAYIATYRTTPDFEGDIIEPGAFTKSLASSPKIPMLWQHDTKQPCGHWFSYASDSRGILASGKFNLSTSWGRDAYGAVKGGDVESFSIGYLTEKATYDRQGVRHLEELNLKEASPVTFAADNAARLVGVKASLAVAPTSIKQVARKAAMEAIEKYQFEHSPAVLAIKAIATVAARKGAANHARTVATNQLRARRMQAYVASRYPR
jgi:HK97 family phage prohead protease